MNIRLQWLSFVLCLLPLLAFADSNVGKKTYETACQTCHTPQMATALKSPAVHDVAAWDARFKLAEDASKADPKTYPSAMAFLISQIRQGKGAMPAGGMCADTSTADKQCTDATYKAAIDFMRSKQK